MDSPKDFFLSVTQRLFSNWTALKMAVEHGMGSKERAIDLCTYITEVMYMNENLSSEDVAAELEEYMDSEFQTELQDNSAMQVAHQLLKFYRYCTEGNEAIALRELQNLPSVQNWILRPEKIRKNDNNRSVEADVDNDSDSDEDNSKEMETCTDDNWVEVKGRRKK